MDSYSGEKNDSEARNIILDIYDKLEDIPDGLIAFDEKIKDLGIDAEGFKKSKASDELMKLCRQIFDDAAETAAKAEKLLLDEGLDRMAEVVADDAAAILALKDIDDIDSMSKAARLVPFARLAANTKDEKAAYALIKDSVQSLHKTYKDKIGEILKYCYSDLDTMLKVMHMEVPYAQTISRLIRRFDELFHDIKDEHKGIDFNDMEQYAYEILKHKEAADYYRDLFQYIFIDEYQDTSYMQEAIISMIAKPDDRFMVGDIKQSIYYFRKADPEIFQNKYDEYKRDGNASIKIDLNKNFRSKPPVIREVNNIFRPLMEGYDEDAELKCGVEAGEHALPEPKTYIVDTAAEDVTDEEAVTDGDEEIEEMSKEELEARQAVQIIREVHGKEYTDPESGAVKKIDYRDIVILMRSFKYSGEEFRDIFREAGIPLYVEDREGYFNTIEVNVALALLQVIDNKRQDVPFIALLRSEIFGFSCEELALIRKLHRYGSYVDAAEAVAYETESAGVSGTPDNVEKLSRKCRHVFDEIKKWQTYAVTLPLADMIWRILNETGYYIITGTYPRGAMRQANLRLLTDRAREYSERSFGSLYGFIRYIDTLRNSKVDMPQATLFSENENVVRIMTIHGSKGLEFPVVILAGMDRQPRQDSIKGITFDRELGIGLTAKDHERHLCENTLIQRIIAAKVRKAEVDEFRRLYYVAVTRARESFYLLAATDYEKIITGIDIGQHPDTTLMKMSRYLPNIEYVSATELKEKPLVPPDDAVDTAADDDGDMGTGQKRAVSAEEIVARLGYEYPYAFAGELAAKTSVTGLNQARMRESVISGPGEDAQDSGRLHKPDIPGMSDEYETVRTDGATESSPIDDAVPAFLRESKKITAAMIGTVYHKLMEKLDFSRVGKEGYTYIAGKAAELVSEGLFTEDEVKAVDLGKIRHFFETDLGRRCIAASEKSMLYKEQPFESKVEISGEAVLVQGVIDCYFEDDDGVVLIDYKTNRIDGRKSLDEEKARIREMYRMQLDMYADAIQKATGAEVKEKYLYLFAIGEAVAAD